MKGRRRCYRTGSHLVESQPGQLNFSTGQQHRVSLAVTLTLGGFLTFWNTRFLVFSTVDRGGGLVLLPSHSCGPGLGVGIVGGGGVGGEGQECSPFQRYAPRCQERQDKQMEALKQILKSVNAEGRREDPKGFQKSLLRAPRPPPPPAPRWAARRFSLSCPRQETAAWSRSS